MDAKQKILNAFNELICEQDFYSVTVRQIVRKAGVSRATFYRHFHDKYDVMNYNFSYLIESSIAHRSFHTMEDLFVLILEKGKEVWHPLLPLFNTEGANNLKDFICDYSYQTAERLYEYGNLNGSGKKKRTLNAKEHLQLKIFCYGCAGFFEDWIGGKYSLNSVQAAQALYESLPECLRGELISAYSL